MKWTTGAIAVLLYLLLGYHVQVRAQRFLTLDVDGLSRSYWLVNPAGKNSANPPLIVLMHDSHVLPASLAAMNWTLLSQSPVMVFPVALQRQWACVSGNNDSLTMDTNFILKTIFHVQNNFKTDPSRVFIVGMGDAFCLADYFSKKHPALVRAALHWTIKRKNYVQRGLYEPDQQLDSVIEGNALMKVSPKPGGLLVFDREQNESKPFTKRSTLNIHVARWQQSRRSRTNFDSLTMSDLSDHHFMFGAQVAYPISEKWSAYLEGDFMIIPREKRINSISWGGSQGVRIKASGRGGLVVSYGTGIRYTIPRAKFRPFVSGSLGGVFMYLGGGTASGGVGGVNMTVTKRKENVLRYSFGSGFEWVISEATAIQLAGQYINSRKVYPAIASVDRFEGISILLGLVFKLGKRV